MRIGGVNVVAVIGAALAIYLIGFVIYGVLLTPEQWMRLAGISQAELDAVGMSRMPFGPVMPLMIALFLGVLFRLGKVASAAEGLRWAMVVALASAIPALLYGWVYGTGLLSRTLLDCGHLLAGHAVAGLILGRWR